jgi:hypothetical protein
VLREDCYRILELPPGASTEDVKQVYRDLVRVWHPDRFSDERLRQIAEQKLKEVNLAYESLLTETFDSPNEESHTPEEPTTPEPAVTRRRLTPFAWLGIAVLLIVAGIIVWKEHSQKDEAVAKTTKPTNAPINVVMESTPSNVPPVASFVPDPEAPVPPNDFVLKMNGAREYVTIPGSFLKLNPEALTIECWVFVESGTGRNMRLLSKGDGSDVNSDRAFDLAWMKEDKVFQFEIFLERGGYALVRAPEVQNRWIHLAAAYDSKTGWLTLHTNGAIAAMKSTDLTTKTPLRGKRIRSSGYGLRIGGAPFPRAHSTGCIDEVRIWTKARSAKEIKREMNQHLAGDEPNLLGYWNFDAAEFRRMKNVQIEQDAPKFVLRNSVKSR